VIDMVRAQGGGGPVEGVLMGAIKRACGGWLGRDPEAAAQRDCAFRVLALASAASGLERGT
jgi:hypothetical protein